MDNEKITQKEPVEETEPKDGKREQNGLTVQERHAYILEMGMKLGYLARDHETGWIINPGKVKMAGGKTEMPYEQLSGILDKIRSRTMMGWQDDAELGAPSAKLIDGMDDGCSPDCEICHGVGYIRYDAAIGDPYFGKVLPCPNRNFSGFYQSDSGLDASEYKLDWSAVMDINNSLDVADSIKETIKQGYGIITLWGGNGLAKTTMLKIAVASYIRDKKARAGYARMAEIIDNLRDAYDSDNAVRESRERLDVWAEMPLLAIDEFERIRDTEYSTERKFLLMDRRYESALRKESITIIATNKDPKEYDGYLYDRLRDQRFKLIHLEGESARPLMTWGD